MSQVTAVCTTVYFSPTKGRRYLSLNAAINAETRAIIFAKYPYEKPESEGGYITYPGYDIRADEPERFDKMYRRLRRLVAAAAKRKPS